MGPDTHRAGRSSRPRGRSRPWLESGDPRRAFDARVWAAEALWDASSSADVGDQWLAAFRLIHDHPGLVTPEEHGDVLACVLITVQWWEHVKAILRAGADAFRHPELPYHDLVVLTRYLGSVWADDIECVPPTREELVGMIDTWSTATPSRLSYRTAYDIGRAVWRCGSPEDLPPAIEVVERLARGIPDVQTRAVSAVHSLRLIALAGSPPAERLLHVMDGVERGRRLDTWSQAELVVNAAAELSLQGDLVGAWRQCQNALSLVPSVEASALWVPIANNVAQVGFLVGEWDTVLAVAAQGATAPIGRANRNNLLFFASLVRALRGDLIPRSEVDPGKDDSSPRAVLGIASATALRLVDPAGARLLLDAGWDEDESPLQEPELDVAGPALSCAAELAWRDRAATEDYVERITSRIEQAAESDRLGDIWSAQVKAHLARARQENRPAPWEALIGSWDDLRAPHQAAEARVRLAECLLHQDDRAAAAAALGRALTTSESLGARLLSDEIRTLASRARLHLPGHESGRGHTGPLTAREHEVLQLLVQGMTNDQIGSTLFMSPRTASVHVSHILQKLSAANRTEVAAIAHRQGLVTMDS